MTAEEYYKQVINDFDQDYHDPETHPFAFAEAYHRAELERLVEEVDNSMIHRVSSANDLSLHIGVQKESKLANPEQKWAHLKLKAGIE